MQSKGVCLTVAAIVLFQQPACSQDELPAASRQQSVFVSDSYAGRNYRLYVPSSYTAGRALPLVLMLHGCTQDPAQFATGTAMNTLAESQGFFALYPEQPSSANGNKCWQWWLPAHQARGSGEPASLANLVQHIASTRSVDASRIYSAGLSSGAAMTVILGATYPDLFAAIAVGSGLEYKAASGSTIDAYSAMSSGGPSPITQGRAAYAAMGAAKQLLPVIVFHGTSDTTVAPVNGSQIVSQWAKTDDLASDGVEDANITDTADSTVSSTVSGGRAYTTSFYRDHKSGAVVLEKVLVTGMGHAWSGGSSAGSYTDPKGPDASLLAWEFFRSHARGAAPPVDAGTGSDGSAVDAGHPPPPPDMGTVLDLHSSDAANDAGSAPDLRTPPTGFTLRSIDPEDGFVGALVADGSSAATLKAGDKGMFNSDTYRSILSFDASALPAGHPTSAQLILTRKAQSGAVSALLLDVKSGSFGAGPGLVQADYGAAATATGVATITPPTRDGAAVSITLPAAALAAISRGDRVQLRLRAVTATDFPADAIELFDGSSATYAPTLILNY